MKNNASMSATEQMLAETEMIARAAAFGVLIDVDPDVADHMGAFEETALDVFDADESRFDVDPETGIVVDDSEQGSVDHGQT